MDVRILVFVIGLLIIGLGILVAIKAKKKQHKPDYYAFFILGMAWIPIGLATDNALFSILGLIFAVVGLVHRKEWKQNHKSLQQLSHHQRHVILWLVLGMTALLVISVLLLILMR